MIEIEHHVAMRDADAKAATESISMVGRLFLEPDITRFGHSLEGDDEQTTCCTMQARPRIVLEAI